MVRSAGLWHDHCVPTITPQGAGRGEWPRGERPVTTPPRAARQSVSTPYPAVEPSGSWEQTGGWDPEKGGPESGDHDVDRDDIDHDEIEVVPVRRLLSLAIATFAGLLAVGLIFGAQTAGVGNARYPYAVVIFGVQALFVLAWTMATRPPGLPIVAGVGIIIAGVADVAAVTPTVAAIAPLGYAAAAGFVASVLGQLLRRADRGRVTESLGSTLVLVVGVVAFATLIVLTRRPVGTQAIVVCLTATGLALLVARLTDAFLPWPRMADQVPRGALGVILGAIIGTAAATGLGAYISGFSPQSAALVGAVSAGAGVLVDLAVGYAEASRELAGEPPTMWLARHMQGPLSGFALAAPLAYVMSMLFLVPAG